MDDWDSDDDIEFMDYYEDPSNEDFGCWDPERCIMPGLHFPSDCHTAEDLEAHWAYERHMDLLCTSRWYRFKYWLVCLPSDVRHWWADVVYKVNRWMGKPTIAEDEIPF